MMSRLKALVKVLTLHIPKIPRLSQRRNLQIIQKAASEQVYKNVSFSFARYYVSRKKHTL